MKRHLFVCFIVVAAMLCSSASHSLERLSMPARPATDPGNQGGPGGIEEPAISDALNEDLVIPDENAGPVVEAPAGFDGFPNGLVDDETFANDRDVFDEFEVIADGLGPLYNAQSCRECHQNPISGSISQVTELRAGHMKGKVFQTPAVPIMHGQEIITGRSLINDRAICPNGQFPNGEIQERVPLTETIRTFRTSLNLLGDGFVEAVDDQTLVNLSADQKLKTHGRIHGQVIYVPVLEAPGTTRAGKFGWKSQHASLLSFSADAYLNEMGITSRLQPDEVTNICNDPSIPQPNDQENDIDVFARFIRATKAPARDVVQAQTPEAMTGEKIFTRIGCAVCHVPTMKTAPAGTVINGGTFTVPEALGGKTSHPYGDFLLHNVGTGDGIVQGWTEHYGRNVYEYRWPNLTVEAFNSTQFKMRTAPLWGVRFRSRLMHDAESLTFIEAIKRHRGEAGNAATRFLLLPDSGKLALFEFLKSL